MRGGTVGFHCLCHVGALAGHLLQRFILDRGEWPVDLSSG